MSTINCNPQLDQLTNERLVFMRSNYILLVTYHLNGKVKIHLGDKDNRVCRFCERKPPEVSFKNIAHAIPEFVGNKK